MPSSTENSTGRLRANPMFATTHWSVVIRAGSHTQTTQVHDALAKLCQTYWYPVYGYARRRGLSTHDAEDLTQSFFARLLEKNWIGRVDPQRGRFRTFLLTAMSRFLSDDWDRRQAIKRGGGVSHVPLELGGAEDRYQHEAVDHRTPEQFYERRWALTVLDTVLRKLRDEHTGEELSSFEILSATLVGNRERHPYKLLASRLGISEGAARVAVHRLRKRYRQLLREEIAQTTEDDGDVDDEIRHLVAVISTS